MHKPSVHRGARKIQAQKHWVTFQHTAKYEKFTKQEITQKAMKQEATMRLEGRSEAGPWHPWENTPTKVLKIDGTMTQ